MRPTGDQCHILAGLCELCTNQSANGACAIDADLHASNPKRSAKPMRWILPVGPLGISSRKSTFRGTLKSASLLAAKVRRSCSVSAVTFFQNYGCRNLLAKFLVRHAEGDNLGDCWMVHQYVVNLTWRNLLATAVDNFLETACKVQISFGINSALVAGAEPALTESLAIRLWVIGITRGHVLTS